MTKQQEEARRIVIYFQFQNPPIMFDVAKNYAKIAVKEKIITCNKFYDNLSFPTEVKSDGGYIHFKKELEYLNNVIEEIDKL